MSRVHVSQLLGLAGFALVLALGATAFGARLSGRRAWLGAVALAAVAVAGIPVHGIPLAGYPRGVLGDLSITTLLMLAASLAAALAGRSILDERSRAVLSGWAVAAGLVLYPLTLGLTRFDPYELGFRPRALVLLVAALVVLWWWRRRGAALVLAGGVAAFNLRVLESGNLWDYLLDPALVAWAVCVSVARIAGGRIGAVLRAVQARLRAG
jgi:hypothetical protein